MFLLHKNQFPDIMLQNGRQVLQLLGTLILNQGFPHTSDIRRHVKLIHDEKFDPDQHIKIVHEKKEPFSRPATISNESFLHQNDTKSDSINKSNKENNSTTVDTFNRNNILEDDPLNSDKMSVHEEKKPCKSVDKFIMAFKCKICEYKAGTKSKLTKHTKSVHEGIKPFKCNICEYECGENWKLMRHIASVHDQNMKNHMLVIHERTKIVTRYVYDICKYPKRAYQQLKVLFIPTWYKEFKNMQKNRIKRALFEGKSGEGRKGLDWQCI
jgi:hypothetical protein